VFRKQVLPLLQEYFFEDWQKIAWVLNDHRKSDASLRFLQRADISVGELFGDGVDLPGDARLWRVNEAAFNHSDAYRSVIKAV
jgi:5-methylcytosine-specific restriction protein B